jgi:hypothetical protein
MKQKAEVDYSLGMGNDRCKNCRHFVKPGQCRKVWGAIDPQYWCKLFRPK